MNTMTNASQAAPSADDRPITAAGIHAAAERLRGHALITPLIENDMLNDRVGGRVLLKAEALQHCGSFKFRGAFNRMSQLVAQGKKVVSWPGHRAIMPRGSRAPPTISGSRLPL